MKRLPVHVLQADGTRDTTTFLRGDGTWDVPPGSGSATFHGCKARRTATQSLTNNTNTAVLFTAADDYDTDAIHDPSTNSSRFTIPAGMSGVWPFKYSIEIAYHGTGLRSTFFSINGTPKIPDGSQRWDTVSGGTETTRLTGTADLILVAGDYVEVLARQTSGGALNIDTAVMSAYYKGAP